MPSLQAMALVDLSDGKGPRHIPGLVWSPVSRLFEATLDDPHGRPVFLGGFETPSQAVEAMESMTATFARMGSSMPSTRVGGPKPSPQAASKPR
ncbi:hypothetical protein V5F44_20955 [Xanthobacter sp. V2C-8]|uniref:hypothetical protein n=1 Tax=Xanthobacter albus TaxID=3119929 RepID=UPI003727DBB3